MYLSDLLHMSSLLDVRLAEYRSELRALWLKKVPTMLLISVAVLFGSCFVATSLMGYSLHWIEWLLVGVVSIAVLIPPIQYMYPTKPTEESITYDSILESLSNRMATMRR